MKNIDLKLIDTRTAQRYINQGLLKKEDYDKYLKSLPDDSENLVSVNFEELSPPALEVVAAEPSAVL